MSESFKISKRSGFRFLADQDAIRVGLTSPNRPNFERLGYSGNLQNEAE